MTGTVYVCKPLWLADPSFTNKTGNLKKEHRAPVETLYPAAPPNTEVEQSGGARTVAL